MHSAPRTAEALRARRDELSATLPGLDGGHRARLRAEVALLRLDAEAELQAAHRDLRVACIPWLAGGSRRRLPAVLAPALTGVGSEWLARNESRILAAVARARARIDPGRIAGVRRPSAIRVDGTGPPDPPVPTGLFALRHGGAGVVRMLLVAAAGAPALGLTAAAARPLLPLAAGVALALVGFLAFRRREVIERERWAAWVDEDLRRAAVASRAALTARVIELEQQAGEMLDRLAAARRAEVRRALRELGAGGGEPGDGR